MTAPVALESLWSKGPESALRDLDVTATLAPALGPWRSCLL